MSERHGDNWQEEHGDDPSVWNEAYGKPNHGKLYLIGSLVDKSIVQPHRRRSATTTISTPSTTTYTQEHISRLEAEMLCMKEQVQQLVAHAQTQMQMQMQMRPSWGASCLYNNNTVKILCHFIFLQYFDYLY